MCLNITCLGSVGTDEISQSEESHQDQYCQMLYILPEQTQFSVFQCTFYIKTMCPHSLFGHC